MKGDEQCHAHSTCSDLEVVKLWFQFHSSAMANDDSHFSFLGQTNFKPGWWVGVKYDEPFGKNDGRYWILILKIFYLCLDLNLSWLHFNEIVHVCRCSLIEVQKYFNLKFGSQPNYDLKFINQGERKKIIVLVGFENFSIGVEKINNILIKKSTKSMRCLSQK